MNDREFWSFLGNMREQKAAWHDWRHYYGRWPFWEKFRDRYLCLTNERADSVECGTVCREACWREVYGDADEEMLEASCPEGEDGYPLTTQDILIYTLHRHELHKEICSAFGIEHRESKMESCVNTWRLGDFIPLAGMVFPAYISFPYDREELLETVKHLCLFHEKPFILICPTREKLYLQAEQLLYSRKALYVSLEEELFFTQNGEINAHRKSEDIFALLLQTLPEPYKNEPVFFPTPPGAKWTDVHIHFINEQNITVQVKECKAALNYFEMGMSSALHKGPIDRWYFLRSLADGNGAYGWNGAQPSIAKKKQKQLLCEDLRDFFRISGEPIYWDEGHKAYIANFQIRPDTYSTNWKGKRKKTSA